MHTRKVARELNTGDVLVDGNQRCEAPAVIRGSEVIVATIRLNKKASGVRYRTFAYDEVVEVTN